MLTMFFVAIATFILLPIPAKPLTAPAVNLTLPAQVGELEDGQWRKFSKDVIDRDRARVARKYAHAEGYLHGVGLNPLPNITIDGVFNVSTAAAATSGKLGLVDYDYDEFYYGGLNFGSPAQVLNVDIDTGSSDLWVASACSKCGGKQYNSGASSTYRSTGKSFSDQYGTGQVAGTLVIDTVSLAGLAVKQQYFGAVKQESNDFMNLPTSGLIGLAFSSIASSGKPTVFENLLIQKTISSPVFSVYMTRDKSTGSELCMGCINTAKTSGPVTWLPVISQTYWTVRMTGAIVNRATLSGQNIYAAIDTGTTLVYLPNSLTAAIYAQIPGSKLTQYGYYTFPCSTSPAVSLLLNGMPFSINIADFNLGRTNSFSMDCVGGILPMGNGFPSNLAIVGDEFLKSWYSTYDYSNGSRVGLWRSIN